MLTREPVQHLKHACDPEEFEQYKNGTKTFDLKLNDGVFSLREGDLITFEEADPKTGELTGRKELKRVGTVVNTATLANVASEEVAEKGLSVFSLVDENHQTLYALYANGFTISVEIDKHEEHPDSVDEPIWEIVGAPAFTPALSCPDFIHAGALDSLNIHKWPIGKYSVTLLIAANFESQEPPYEMNILDAIIMVVVPIEGNDNDFMFVELNAELLTTGMAIALHTGKKVEPLHLDDVYRIMAQPISEEELEDYPDIISDAQMQQLLKEARQRGEDVDELEEAFLGNDEEEEEDE